MTTERIPRPYLVRVDPDTRAALLRIAGESDRSVSQLVRYATVWWMADPDRVCPVAGVGGDHGTEEFVNVRFDAAQTALVAAVAAQMGLKRSAVIRCALRSWLASGDFSALGDPKRAFTTNDTSVRAAS